MRSKNEVLKGKKVAILATDGFEESELLEPKKALEDAGADVEVISIKAGKIKSWAQHDWGQPIAVDHALSSVLADSYDALLLPGGVLNADKIRAELPAVEFVNQFVDAGKPIAAICHGAWVLLETGKVSGRKMTSYPAIKTDLVNAGVNWVDDAVVVDRGWVSSRKPADIPAFNAKMIEEFAEGAHIQSSGKATRRESELRV